MSSLLIQGGRVIDPANGRDGLASVLIRDGRIAAVWGSGESAPAIPEGTAIEDATGLIVCPGFIDLHVSLREPL